MSRAALSYVSLGVEDLGRAVRFYGRALGLAPEKRARTMAFFAPGPVRLALLPRAVLRREAGIARGSGGLLAARGFSGVLLSLNVDRREEVAGLLRRVVAAGGRIVRPEAASSWGGTTGVFADPDGHLWEVAWNPRFRSAGSARPRGSPPPARRPR